MKRKSEGKQTRRQKAERKAKERKEKEAELRSYSEARSSTQHRSHASQQRTTTCSRNDINTFFQDTDVLLRGMKQIQKQQTTACKETTTKHTRKQTCKQLSQTGRHKRKNKTEAHHRLAGNAQIPAREFQFASHKVQADSLSRISLLYFRSIWATKKCLGLASTSASDRNPLPYWHADNNIPKDMLETPTSYESECRSPRQTGLGAFQ